MGYNKTQLTPLATVDRMIAHRDQWAHLHRFYYVINAVGRLKLQKPNILDFGCGSGQMLELFYRNRFAPNHYVGIDIREKTVESNYEKFSSLDEQGKVDFIAGDLCSKEVVSKIPENNYDIITCFEVAEHVGKGNIDNLLSNISNFCSEDTLVLLSTPNYDKIVGAAKNHIIDGEIGEWDYFELNEKLNNYFTIEKEFGTFASIKDYKKSLTEAQLEVFNQVREYYDPNMLSVFFAPMIKPQFARNVLRVMKVRR